MNEKSIQVKIETGRYKGKKLALPPLEITRATKSIIKHAYFNTIQFDIHDANFIEMFGGSGSMGLEALSRGAKEAYFIEQNSEAYKVLRKNCFMINPLHTHPVQSDAFSEIFHTLKSLDKAAFLYIDPPFEIREGMDDVYNKVIKTIKKLPKEKIIMITIEHHSKTPFPEQIGNFTCIKSKAYGSSTLSHYQPC